MFFFFLWLVVVIYLFFQSVTELAVVIVALQGKIVNTRGESDSFSSDKTLYRNVAVVRVNIGVIINSHAYDKVYLKLYWFHMNKYSWILYSQIIGIHSKYLLDQESCCVRQSPTQNISLSHTWKHRRDILIFVFIAVG